LLLLMLLFLLFGFFLLFVFLLRAQIKSDDCRIVLMFTWVLRDLNITNLFFAEVWLRLINTKPRFDLFLPWRFCWRGCACLLNWIEVGVYRSSFGVNFNIIQILFFNLLFFRRGLGSFLLIRFQFLRLWRLKV